MRLINWLKSLLKKSEIEEEPYFECEHIGDDEDFH